MAPGEEDGPHGAASAPAKSPGLALDRLLLVLAVLSAALVFWPLTAETALLHWNIIGGRHEFIGLLPKLGLWSCLACVAAFWLLEKEKEERGHQAIVFAMLAAPLFIAAQAIVTLVFEGWWQVLRLTPAAVYGGLAYAFLAEGSGRDPGPPPDDEAA